MRRVFLGLLLASLCLPAVGLQARAKGDKLERWVRALRTTSLSRRRRAVQKLKGYGPKAIRALHRAVAGRSNRMRAGAMYALAKLHPKPSPALRRLLLKRLRRSVWYVRGAASYALAHSSPDKTTLRALVRALKDRSWRVKGNAITGLIRAGAEGKRALRRATRHKDPTVRMLAGALLRFRPRPAPQRRSSASGLRVMTYNICHAEGMDGSYSLSRIAGILRSSRADIISLHEVDHKTRRSHGHRQAALLARMLKLPRAGVAFGPAIAFQGGTFGNAILSRHRILTRKTHKLPRLGGWEERSILDVVVRYRRRKLRVLATHLDNRSRKARRHAVKKLNALAKASKYPVVLLGDLNATHRSKVLRSLHKLWKNVTSTPKPTMPSTVPLAQIDHILVYPGRSWKVLQTRTPSGKRVQIASDHRPFTALLQLRK